MAKMSKELQSIPVDCILPNKNQPRKTFDDDTLGELAASIRAVGIIQPLSVERIQDGTYTLISGERRLRAAKLAGLTHVPCVLIRAEEKDLDVMSLVENIQREDLNYVEEAKAYEKLIEKYGFTQKDLSEKVGKRQSTISNKLRILKLGHKVLAKITECGLSERHARALLNIPDTEMRLQAAETIAKKNLSVRQTE
jgi:ParB family chromosome partitioning protein